MPEVQQDMRPPQTAAAGPSAPYVGLRPYEREERDIFIGRDLDAQYLTDKIFSARLTLLYSKSGLGKSSILRTLVIPSLEEQEARVVYFDAWGGEDPIASLKSELIQLATDLGIPDAGAGSPSLAELALLISSFDRRTLVLMLDQFEEFLVHQQWIDLLGAELAELVRLENIDVRLLISLRQEFLAALEPLRQRILNLFQSTYMMENLGDEAVRNAIEIPARTFGKDYGPGLLNRLLDDLRHPSSKPGALASTRNGARIELPMLQLVCNELWKAARKVSTITIDLYEQLGGVRKILQDYVRRVMPSRLRDGYLTARLLVPLAPPSGLKLSYSVDDLASITGLDGPRIRGELNRLEKRRILRTRKFQKSERFELLHDSFIKIVAPWRDRILDRVRLLRRRAWKLAALCAVVLVGVGWFQVVGIKQLELYTNTEGALEELRSMPAGQQGKFVNARLDNAASYMLWRQDGPERLIGLKEMLQKYSDLQPRLYGIDRTGMGSMDYPDEEWPVSFHYSFKRKLRWDGFSATWNSAAKIFAQEWNIPVPKRLRCIRERTFPAKLVQFKGPDAVSVDLDIGTHEADAMIDISGLMPAAKEFFDQFQTDWKRIEETQAFGSFYIVPRWSLAAWRASGVDAIDGSGLPPFLLALKLKEHPEGLLSSQAVELLMERVQRSYPHTASEARTARGPRLRQDLIEWVKRGRTLTHLPVILDALANFPHLPPPDAVTAVGLDLVEPGISTPVRRFTGPWPRPQAAGASPKQDPPAAKPATKPTDRKDSKDKIHAAYREVEPWLPPVEDEVRVFVGQNLKNIWFPNYTLSAELQEHIEALSDDFFRRFGFHLPVVKFKGPGWDPDIAPDAIRIELLNESAADTRSVVIDTHGQGALDQLEQALWERVRKSGGSLLTAERVEELISTLDPALEDWLYAHYSLTDLKLLGRAVIDLDPVPLHRLKKDAMDATPPAGEGALRNFGWLMGSLVFWNQIDDSWTIQALAEALQSTQQARFQPPAGGPASGPLATAMADGLRKLRDRRLEQARLAFKRAADIDSKAAVRSFLAAYATHLPLGIEAQIDRVCASPTGAGLTRSQRLYLEERLAGKDPAGAPEIQRRNVLCLYSSYPDHCGRRKRELSRSLLTQYGSPDRWPAAEARWIAAQVLKDFDPVEDDPALLQKAAAFLKSAIPRLKPQQSNEAYISLLKVCEGTGARNWCWDLAVDIAEAHPTGHIPLELALSLGHYQEHARYQRQALDMLTMAEKNLRSEELQEKDSKRMLALIQLARAQALSRLGALGDASHLPEAEQLFSELLASPGIGLHAHSGLIELLIDQERYPEAARHIQSAIKAWPDEVTFYQEKFWSELLRGDMATAAGTAKEVSDRQGNNDDALFLAALNQILTGNGRWELAGRKFLATRHPYVDYVTMMLYARLAGPDKAEARRLLGQRWARIKSHTWAKRCRAGDARVWREMLIGRYVGAVTSEEIFGKLEDETRYRQSDLRHLPLPRSSMLCEAYFYDAMLAKAEGDAGRMRRQLNKVLDTGKRNYLEYKMAKYLLATEPVQRAES